MTEKKKKYPGLGDRLKKLRELNGLTQEDFLKYGVLSTIYNWESETTEPYDKTLKQIEEDFGLRPKWLRYGEEPMFVDETLQPKSLEPYKPSTVAKRAVSQIGSQSKKTSTLGPSNNHEKIKQLRSQVAETIKKTNSHPGIRLWAVAGAGNPFTVDPAQDEPMEILHIESLVSPRYRDAFRIAGNSMEPVIRNRAIVFCDFNDKAPKPGNIYAFNLPEQGLVIKELRAEKPVGEPFRWVIYSYNEKYSPHHYSDSELKEENCIVGRIVLVHQELEREGVIAKPAITPHSEEYE